jgi:hypothetical protein
MYVLGVGVAGGMVLRSRTREAMPETGSFAGS